MKRVLTMAALVAVFATTAGVAVAQEIEPASPAEVTIERHTGFGVLWASGSGSATLDVRRAWVAMRVDGDVAIEGDVNHLIVNGADPDAASGDGTKVHLDDFTGWIVVAGSHYTVEITGDVSLHGVGTGQATFRGDGWWRTLRDRGSWAGSDPIPDLESRE